MTQVTPAQKAESLQGLYADLTTTGRADGYDKQVAQAVMAIHQEMANQLDETGAYNKDDLMIARSIVAAASAAVVEAQGVTRAQAVSWISRNPLDVIRWSLSQD